VVFEIEKTIKYWLESASYDLDTGRTLLESKRFPYALFFGHLALEKILKALVVKATKQHAPYTHSLPFLASQTNLEIPETTVDQLA
jgi:HEPN domain-containing protein